MSANVHGLTWKKPGLACLAESFIVLLDVGEMSAGYSLGSNSFDSIHAVQGRFTLLHWHAWHWNSEKKHNCLPSNTPNREAQLSLTFFFMYPRTWSPACPGSSDMAAGAWSYSGWLYCSKTRQDQDITLDTVQQCGNLKLDNIHTVIQLLYLYISVLYWWQNQICVAPCKIVDSGHEHGGKKTVLLLVALWSKFQIVSWQHYYLHRSIQSHSLECTRFLLWPFIVTFPWQWSSSYTIFSDSWGLQFENKHVSN